MELFGGIEAGGTKFICIVGTGPEHIVSEVRFPTTTPDATMQNVIAFFTPFAAAGTLSAIGIASFGPLDLNPASKSYGHITTTPKTGWQNTDLRGIISRSLNLPIELDTDVNAAAFGEYYWATDKPHPDPLLYMTVGTGIGVGVIIDGKPLHGLIHPETGHIAIPHDRQRDPFQGACPYHGDCLEGLASGYAMSKRWNQVPETLPDDHPAWELEAEYLGFAILNLFYAYSPRQIVLGGGVSQHNGLIQSIRTKVLRFNNGYARSDMLLDKIDTYLRRPVLGNRSGVLGAMAMAIYGIEK